MSILLLALAQAVWTPPERINLTIPDPCKAERSASDEVVVCASSGDASPYRIERMPPRKAGLPKAELQIAEGVSASAETEDVDVGGIPSKRGMVRLKIKF